MASDKFEAAFQVNSMSSKQIQKVSRKILRKHQNEEATKMLQQFSGLSDLPKHQEYPIKKS